MSRASRYVLRRPGLFIVGFLSILLVGILVNAVVFGYLEMTKLREHWRERFTIRAFFREDVDKESRERQQKDVAAHPLVERAILVSPEEARRRFLEHMGLQEEDLQGVSFPSSLEIVVRRIEDLPGFVQDLLQKEVFEEVLYGGKGVENFLHLFRLLMRSGGLFLLSVLGFGVFVIVVITAFGVQLREKEVRVLSLVGATSGFSRAPFLLEGVLAGLCGGAGAYLTSFAFLIPFLRLVEGVFPGFFWVNGEELLVPFLALDLGGGCFVGVLGAILGYWGTRRKAR